MKKKLLVLTLAVLTVLTFCVQSVSAATNETAIMPRYSHLSSCSMYFTISSSGSADVDVYYTGSEDFYYASVSVEIQKLFLGVFWRTVDIGYDDNTWVEVCVQPMGSFSNSFQLDDTGTYRAKIEVKVVGTDGSVERIEDKIERTYG